MQQEQEEQARWRAEHQTYLTQSSPEQKCPPKDKKDDSAESLNQLLTYNLTTALGMAAPPDTPFARQIAGQNANMILRAFPFGIGNTVMAMNGAENLSRISADNGAGENLFYGGLAALDFLGSVKYPIAPARGTETFYRTMSLADYNTLRATGKLPATYETFVSPSLEYASQYDGVTVRFHLQTGTTDSLLDMGVRNSAKAFVGTAYERLPISNSSWSTANGSWTASRAFFKFEDSVVNVGLGRGPALNTFNNNIVNFKLVPKK